MTEAQKIASQIKMFGCTAYDIDEALEEMGGDYRMLAMAMISDAQEEIAYDNNRSRQFMNRAKYVISRHFPR